MSEHVLVASTRLLYAAAVAAPRQTSHSRGHGLPTQAYVLGDTKQSVAQVAAMLRAEKEARERQRSVGALLAAEGLQDYRFRVPSLLRAFVSDGEGSAEAVVAEARARRATDEACTARRTAIFARLEAEGLQGRRSEDSVQAYIRSGEGSEEEVVAAARAAAAATAAAAQARDARRTRMTDLLAAEGLQRYAIGYEAPALWSYITSGEGSEEAALAAAREAAAANEALQARERGLLARLQAEGIAECHRVGVPAVHRFVSRGEGSEEAAAAAVREAAQRAQQREARCASVTAALAAVGQTYASLRWHVPALEAYVRTGEGSEAAVLAAARRVWQVDANRRERQELVGEERETAALLGWQLSAGCVVPGHALLASGSAGYCRRLPMLDTGCPPCFAEAALAAIGCALQARRWRQVCVEFPVAKLLLASCTSSPHACALRPPTSRVGAADAALAAEGLQMFRGFPWEANSRDKVVACSRLMPSPVACSCPCVAAPVRCSAVHSLC